MKSLMSSDADAAKKHSGVLLRVSPLEVIRDKLAAITGVDRRECIMRFRLPLTNWKSVG